MRIVVLADALQKEELETKQVPAGVTWYYAESPAALESDTTAAAFFLLDERLDFTTIPPTGKPLFVNAVEKTLHGLNAASYVNRINGWPGFLQRETWEVVSNDPFSVREIFERLQWKYVLVPDVSGMVAGRVIATIINEAYYALQEKVGTREDIDLAMKLGTGYPYGPFEWAGKIGLNRIYSLLNSFDNDEVYPIAENLRRQVESSATINIASWH